LSPQSLVIIAAITMLALALGIVVFVMMYQRRVINHQQQLRDFNRRKQEELMQASIRSEEEERMRVAAELHDDVGATLSSIRLMLYKAARDPGDDAIINQARLLLDESIQKVRNLSHQLQPGTLQYLGLNKSIQSLAEMLTRTGQITVQCNAADAWPALDGPTELALYRIIQELLNNITKHSGASNVTIQTSHKGGVANITITHNGDGLNERTYQEMLYKKGAIGLKNIESRLKSAGASIAFFAKEKMHDTATIILSLPVLTGSTGI
jgi:signal transduction histidine kinase